MGKTIKLKKGYSINIKGVAQQSVESNYQSRTYAVKPTDFHGISPIPKILYQVGDEVKAGDALFFDKKAPSIMHCAPVSGEIAEIRRGAKRKIESIVILADKNITFKSFERMNYNSASRTDLVNHLLSSGCWPFFKQRPYNTIADPKVMPKAIFVSGFDSAPLAADYNFACKGETDNFQTGMSVLGKLSAGKVHLGLDGDGKTCDTFQNASGVEKHQFSGPHPAGNVGVQIHHLDPISRGEVVWTIDPQSVITIGRLFNHGKFDTSRLVAFAGSAVKSPKYYKTYLGASIDGMAKGNITSENVRYILGNVLTGSVGSKESFLGVFDNVVTVIEEGNKRELFGWLFPTYARPSASRTFPAFLRPNKAYDVNTNTHGEPRAFVLTGVYEKVTPMDIYPMQLVKSILYRDLDQMEGLGIYEMVEEDVALCEFVCPSKNDFQEILREGLDYMKEQG